MSNKHNDYIYSRLKDMDCFHKTSVNYSTGFHPPYHRHDEYEIYLFIKGNSTLYIEDNCHRLSPNDMVMIYPGTFHRTIVTETSSYERIVISIPKEIIGALSSGQTNLDECFHTAADEISKIIHITPYGLKRFTKIADNFLTALQSSEYGSDLMSVSFFTELLIYIYNLFQNSEIKNYDNIMPPLVINTMKYIEDNLTDELTLDRLGTAVNYSTNYLRVQFRRHTGLSLREYILDKRIERAKKLLMDGKNVSDACLMSGFNDYSNFIRSFKKKTGISPGHYAKSFS